MIGQKLMQFVDVLQKRIRRDLLAVVGAENAELVDRTMWTIKGDLERHTHDLANAILEAHPQDLVRMLRSDVKDLVARQKQLEFDLANEQRDHRHARATIALYEAERGAPPAPEEPGPPSTQP
jgi:hypothetical protein